LADGKKNDLERLIGLLPHRYPFLLVDRVLEFTDERVLTLKNVTVNEPFFTGHFPNVPTMPGVLILEALAQACGLLTSQDTGIRAESGVIFYFAGIDNARFKRIVVPGDQLTLDVAIDKIKRNLWRFKARATVDGELACEADLMCVFKRPPGAEEGAAEGAATEKSGE
jgi:3-hydroxyacyl-[acyl-carrier-protein] dehydratase